MDPEELSAADIETLTYTVLGEAEGEGVLGMLAVANVIRNRTQSPLYPDNPVDVALEPQQFSTNNPGEGGNQTAVRRRNPVGSGRYETARQIIEQIFVDDLDVDNTGGALFYHTTAITPYWSDSVNTNGTVDIGHHRFYPRHPIPPMDIPEVLTALDIPRLRKAPVPADVLGMLEKGNIDLTDRPVVRVKGGFATVNSISIEEDGKEVLIPTITPTGYVMGDDEAIARYHKTGEHLGKFTTAEAADIFAENLHKGQEAFYAKRQTLTPWVPRNAAEGVLTPGALADTLTLGWPNDGETSPDPMNWPWAVDEATMFDDGLGALLGKSRPITPTILRTPEKRSGGADDIGRAVTQNDMVRFTYPERYAAAKESTRVQLQRMVDEQRVARETARRRGNDLPRPPYRAGDVAPSGRLIGTAAASAKAQPVASGEARPVSGTTAAAIPASRASAVASAKAQPVSPKSAVAVEPGRAQPVVSRETSGANVPTGGSRRGRPKPAEQPVSVTESGLKIYERPLVAIDPKTGKPIIVPPLNGTASAGLTTRTPTQWGTPLVNPMASEAPPPIPERKPVLPPQGPKGRGRPPIVTRSERLAQGDGRYAINPDLPPGYSWDRLPQAYQEQQRKRTPAPPNAPQPADMPPRIMQIKYPYPAPRLKRIDPIGEAPTLAGVQSLIPRRQPSSAQEAFAGTEYEELGKNLDEHFGIPVIGQPLPRPDPRRIPPLPRRDPRAVTELMPDAPGGARYRARNKLLGTPAPSVTSGTPRPRVSITITGGQVEGAPVPADRSRRPTVASAPTRPSGNFVSTTGQQLAPQQVRRFNADTNQFETVTVYRPTDGSALGSNAPKSSDVQSLEDWARAF